MTPAGYADDGCNFGYFRERGAFWTATTDQDNTKAYIKRFQYNKDGVYQDVIPSNYHLSLRLVKDYNGKNYFDVEEIMDMEYPTLLLPSISKGKSIWTSCNFACGNASLCPMLPNNGQGLTYTRHYFINEWNGFKWVRNEMKQGDTVTVAKAPKGKTMVEYRVIGNDLVSVNEMIYNDVIKDVTVITDNLEEKFTERIELVEKSIENEHEERLEVERQLWEGINGEVERAQSVEADLWEGIAKEATSREEVDNQQWTAIENESTTRQSEDAKIYEALAQEVTDRQSEDGKLYEALAQEVTDRQSEDAKIYEALAHETEDRISVDNQQWTAINTEIEERKAANEALQTAIDNETEERKTKDEEIEGKVLTEEGTEFNPNSGKLTLKSAAGTNDIKVQFSFNFGEF